jgi:hypothetical protein
MCGVGGSRCAARCPVWPLTVQRDGCILLARRFDPDTYNEWRSSLGTDVQTLERVLNHVHLYDLLDAKDEALLLDLLDLMVVTWRDELRRAWPDRTFEVVADSSGEDYGPTITFFQSAGNDEIEARTR